MLVIVYKNLLSAELEEPRFLFPISQGDASLTLGCFI